MSPARKPGSKTSKLRSAAQSLAKKVGRKTSQTSARTGASSSTAPAKTMGQAGKGSTPKPATAKSAGVGAKAKTTKPAAKKTTAKKTAAKKTTAKKTTAKKTTAKKTTAKKTTAKKPAAKKTTAKKPAAKKTTAKKPAGTSASGKETRLPRTATKAPARSGAASYKGAMRSVTAPPRPAPARRTRPAKLDAKALADIRARLETEKSDLQRQQAELEEDSFVGTQSEITGEVGLDEDFADAGTATFDRERDLSIQHNIRDLIEQVTRAIDRIDDKTYGTCERCGQPIDAARLKALPHAGLCLDCKRREERTR